MSDKTYGRGQIEWALWCSFAGVRAGQSDVSQVFRTRIKRLLDIDRNLEVSEQDVLPDSDFAFAAPPRTDGSEAEYRPVDVFCLGVALDLLDIGFKQSEVVFLMRYLRKAFERSFPRLLKRPSLLDAHQHPAEDYPGYPTYEDRGVKYADGRVFMILNKVELTEILPGNGWGQKDKPVILAPKFCEGITALGTGLHETLPIHRRAVTVVELTAIAQTVQKWLPEAPIIRRGRPKS